MTVHDVSPATSEVDFGSPDTQKLQQMIEAFKSEENLVAGLLAGIVAAVGSALIWAAITATTGFQIGWMAIGVGFVVGFAVRHFGHGTSTKFGVMGASLALLGCGLGNFFVVVALVSKGQDMSIPAVLSVLDLEISANLMAATFSPMDILFYALAMIQGFKLSFTPIGEAIFGPDDDTIE